MNTDQLEALARSIVRDLSTDQPRAAVLATHGDTTTQLAELGDVYALLTKVGTRPTKAAKTADALTVTTCGWAAPTDDDELPPSLHPKRRRVALAVSVHAATGRTVSALRFADDPEIITDHGQAAGSLADAVAELAAKIRAKQ